MNAGGVYAVILKPEGQLDAVIEIYDTAGIKGSFDEGGQGEIEQFLISPAGVVEWAIVIYSYLDSFGTFALDVHELNGAVLG